MKIFCFPYAGGSSFAYTKWRERLADWIQVVPIELAGRGRRAKSPLYHNFSQAVEDIVSEMLPHLDADTPYALFGHSMGSWLAYEVYYKLKEQDLPLPIHVFFSGRFAPQVEKDVPDYRSMSDADLVRELRVYGGTSGEVLGNPDLLQMFLPIMRADFQMTAEYRHQPRTDRLLCDISILTGQQDIAITRKDLLPWRNLTARSANIYTFPGGHFFIQENVDEVLQLVERTMGKITMGC